MQCRGKCILLATFLAASFGLMMPVTAEVADPVYRDGVVFGINWHAALLYRYNNEEGVKYVIHSDGSRVTVTNWDGFLDGNDFMGARTKDNPSGAIRASIIDDALDQVNAHYWNYTALGWKTPNSSPQSGDGYFRCDGLVEYCYENAGLDICNDALLYDPLLGGPIYQSLQMDLSIETGPASVSMSYPSSQDSDNPTITGTANITLCASGSDSQSGLAYRWPFQYRFRKYVDGAWTAVDTVGKGNASFDTQLDSANVLYEFWVYCYDNSGNVTISDRFYLKWIPSSAPTITSVSPSTFPGLPLPQTRLITITGTGFNASTRLTFNDGTTTYSDRVPASVTATRITYNIAVGPAAATWTVKAVNGSAESAPYTFYVTSSGPAVLSSVSVSGPAAIYEETTSDPFTATAHYSDGTYYVVTPTWSVSSGPASISAAGVLSAGSVDADTAVTVFARYSSGGITKTGSVSVTVVNGSEGGSETQELIVNGGFENGTTGWNMSGPIVGGNAAYPHSGSHYAVLGEVDSCVDVMYQEITVPADATSVTLSYWLNIYSDETGSEGDYFAATLMDENGDLLVPLDIKSNLDRDSGTGSSYYNEATFNLLGYAGETIWVRFAVVMNASGFSSFKLDDVSVQADVPTQVYPFTTTTSNGKITITGYTGSGGSANIPPSINGIPVTSIGDWAFYGWDSLDSVTIPNSVTSIGNQAFNGSGIDSVTIPSSVTSIGDWAFAHCNSLADVTIPSSVSRIGEGAFFECENLVDVIIRNGVTTIGNQAFRWCANLSTVTIPGSVTNIGNQSFDGCSSLTSVTIPIGVVSIGDGAFSSCGDLYSVTIPNSVTRIGEGAFWGCSGLDYVSIPNNVSNIRDWTFFGCFRLGSVTIPSSVTNIGSQSFNSCASLTSVTIPNNVASVGDWAFAHCANLTSVTIPIGVTQIGEGAFYDCPSLTSVAIPNSIIQISDWTFAHCNNLISVTIPNSVTRIGNWAFFDCLRLAGVTIPNSVTSIGDQAFNSCARLAAVTIPSSVTTVGEWAFAHCTNLTSVTIPNSVTSIRDGTFYDCTNLTSVTIPNSVTNIGGHAFRWCSGLTGVTIPDSVSSIGWFAFASCSNLASVTIPHSVSSIGEATFSDCPSLGSVTVPGSVTNIGGLAFESCTNLITIYFKGNAPSFGTGVFSNADSAVVYYLPGTTGWGETFGDRPTEVWRPHVQSDASFGVQTNQFGFNIKWTSGMVVVVEGCMDLINPVWSPLRTNTLIGDSSHFGDPQWTNYPARLYRLRWQ